MPGGVDGVLMLLAASKPSWVLIYVAAAMIGSTAGSVGLYRISRRAGHRALRRFSESNQKRVKDLISAGVFRLNLLRFTIAIAAGRTFRYLLEGYLAARYGEQAKELLARYYPSIGITLAVLIIVAFVATNLMRRNAAAKASAISEAEG